MRRRPFAIVLALALALFLAGAPFLASGAGDGPDEPEPINARVDEPDGPAPAEKETPPPGCLPWEEVEGLLAQASALTGIELPTDALQGVVDPCAAVDRVLDLLRCECGECKDLVEWLLDLIARVQALVSESVEGALGNAQDIVDEAVPEVPLVSEGLRALPVAIVPEPLLAAATGVAEESRHPAASVPSGADSLRPVEADSLAPVEAEPLAPVEGELGSERFSVEPPVSTDDWSQDWGEGGEEAPAAPLLGSAP